MLFKWFFTIAIAYFVYKYYLKPGLLKQGEEQRRSQIRKPEPETKDEGEYIDYEEVD